jgi:hypothetical protein
VVVVDASNPAWLRVVAGLDLVTNPTSIEVGNGVAYVLTDPQLATHTVQLVSLRDPLHPWLIGEHRSPGEALDVALSGNILLVADGDAGLLLLDATECAFPAAASGGPARAGAGGKPSPCWPGPRTKQPLSDATGQRVPIGAAVSRLVE